MSSLNVSPKLFKSSELALREVPGGGHAGSQGVKTDGRSGQDEGQTEGIAEPMKR